MDKKALVNLLRQAFTKVEEDGIAIESVHLIPDNTLFANDFYIAVVSTSSLTDLGPRSKIALINEKLTTHLVKEARKHLYQIWVLDSADKAMNRIEQEVGDETYLITPVLEAAHA